MKRAVVVLAVYIPKIVLIPTCSFLSFQTKETHSCCFNLIAFGWRVDRGGFTGYVFLFSELTKRENETEYYKESQSFTNGSKTLASKFPCHVVNGSRSFPNDRNYF